MKNDSGTKYLIQIKGSDTVLVLTRKVSEWIDIGGGVEVGGVSLVIIEIRGDKVRIGIDAPREVRIDRREVTEAIAAEKAAE